MPTPIRFAHAALAVASIWVWEPACAAALALPNARLTPGDVAVRDAGDVCLRFYSRRHPRRLSNWLKHRVYVEYFGAYRRGFVVDHLVPREIGGADDLLNLWPQPVYESKLKDTIENRVRFEVCAAHRPLVDAQRAFRRDWRSADAWRGRP